jgi:hypothetical protein
LRFGDLGQGKLSYRKLSGSKKITINASTGKVTVKKKTKKTLSKANIYGKKSASSQAKQIYALNKKVNYLQKTTLPETQSITNTLEYYDSKNGSIYNRENHTRLALFRDRILNSYMLKYLKINGDMLKVKKINLYGYFGLKDYTYLTDSSMNVPINGYLKITVGQITKSGLNATTIPQRVTYDLQNLGSDITTSDACNINCINGPLVANITTNVKILKTKVVKITPSTPFKMFKITLKNYKYTNLNYRVNPLSPNDGYSQGEIIVYIDFAIPVMLARDNVNVQPRCVYQLNYRMVYADDNSVYVSQSS